MDRSSREFVQLSQELAKISLESNAQFDGCDDDDDGHSYFGRHDKAERGPGLLALLDVATEFRIPYLLLDKLGMPRPDQEREHFGYTIGAGYSGRVIRHVTEHDVGDVKEGTVVAQGTVVALKQFSPKPPEPGKTPKNMETLMFQAARRELKALCHPNLRAHENICNVLYIGWHTSTGANPMIALELAAYGTLEDVLVAPGIGISWLQKMNITIDVTLAVHAIHACSMIHGDLKPSNVILQHHNARQVVAKIIDLAGSSDPIDELGPSLRPDMSTELWWAPEVCAEGTRGVDWLPADTYSLGLVVASVWGRRPIWSSHRLPSSCFLDKFLPRPLTQSERRDRLIIMKTHGDTHPLSVMQISWTDEGLINPILLGTLAANPLNRVTTATLAAAVIPGLAIKAGRAQATTTKPSAFRPRGTKFLVERDKYICACSPRFHSLVFKHVLQDSYPVYSLLDVELGAIPKLDPSDRDRGDIIQQVLAALETLRAIAKSRVGENAFDLGRLAFYVALSHCLQLGAPLITMRVPSSQRELSARLRPLYLAWGASVGMKSSLDVLQREYSDLHSAILRSLWSRRGSIPRSSPPGSTWPWVKEITSSSTNSTSQPFGIMEALRYHNAVGARHLLEQDGCDASEVGEDGLGIFQALVFLQDEDAASLAPLCLRRGANLQHQAQASTSWCLLPSQIPSSGTALAWAWAFHMPKYFQALLRLHAEYNTIISDYRLLLLHSANGHKPFFLELLLRLRESALSVAGATFDLQAMLMQHRHTAGVSAERLRGFVDELQAMPTSRALWYCLKVSLTDRVMGGFSPVCRRVYHASAEEQRKAEAETVRLLLKETGDIHAALACVSEHTSTSRLETIYDFIAESGPADRHCIEALHMTFTRLLSSDPLGTGSLRCFNILLSRFPELHNGVSTSSTPPIFEAAQRSDPHFVLGLLKMGADADAKHDILVSPLSVAICSGNLETAEAIFQHLTQEQRRRTFDRDETTDSTATGRLLLILRRRPPPTPEHVRRDAKVLEKLFQAFPENIVKPDPKGLMPIHLAAWNGLLDVVKALARMRVDINIESERSTAWNDAFVGRTALDLAAKRFQAEPPDEIRKGGDQEVKRWQQTCKDMVVYLQGQGAKSGSAARIYQLDRVKETGWKSSWPATMKRDRTSLSDDKVEHSRKWMKIRCAGRDMDVSRLFVHSHLGEHFDQPWAGGRNKTPELYGSWLRETAILCLEAWRRTKGPLDHEGLPDKTAYEWHLHGLFAHRQHLEASILERLPRYRVIVYIRPPLSAKSEHDVIMIQLLKALYENSLPAHHLDAPYRIITVYDTEKHAVKGYDYAMKNATEMLLDPTLCGLVFQHILIGNERTMLTEDEQRLLDTAFGDMPQTILGGPGVSG
ncbi:hypothetical protein QBC39DRAFT_436688 [Podospora conica]|nr:hypothetical protein QBC39DRAFT_436688 [Schizothecium conicum]